MEQRFARRCSEMDKRLAVGLLADTKLDTIAKRWVGEETVTRTVWGWWLFFPEPPLGYSYRQVI